LATPSSVAGITPLIGDLLSPGAGLPGPEAISVLTVFHNRQESGEIHQPVRRRILPLDNRWRQRLTGLPWPSRNLAEVIGGAARSTFEALLREYLFVALYRACAESLASENASRLAAMQRASRNIDELLDQLRRTFHHLRQDSIDSELFDLVAGFEALGKGFRGM
jgi:F-type H+-transporting ATPase subunit gamma